MTLGKLTTNKSIERAMNDIRTWLSKIDVPGLTIQTNYDAKNNIAQLRFKFNGKDYEFTSRNQANCRLNMHAIAHAMEGKVRNHIMGIETLGDAMLSHLLLEAPSGYTAQARPTPASEKDYITLGITILASNSELEAQYKRLVKTFHPDNALSTEAKREFEKRMSEINNAWHNIKQERGI